MRRSGSRLALAPANLPTRMRYKQARNALCIGLSRECARTGIFHAQPCPLEVSRETRWKENVMLNEFRKAILVALVLTAALSACAPGQAAPVNVESQVATSVA